LNDRSTPSLLENAWSDWKLVGRRVWANVTDHHIGLVSAGIAFYGLLALFPAITALVAISGFLLDPSKIAGQLQAVSGLLPQDALDIVVNQATEVANSRGVGLSLAAFAGLSVALYSASKGVASLIEGLNIAFEEEETRGILKLAAVRILLTATMIVVVGLALSATLILPSVLSLVDLGTAEIIIGALRWGLFVLVGIFGIAVLYAQGPDRKPPSWRWITPGALIACVAWIAVSVGFSAYVQNFASYNKSFGALAGVVLLLLWLWVTAFVVLLGAEINAALEAIGKQGQSKD
jgi:membrane protein